MDALIKKITKLERSIERDATEAREDFQIRRNEELGKIERKLKNYNPRYCKERRLRYGID